MSDYNFVKYVTEFSYFGLNESYRDYIFLTEAHRNRCSKSRITLCSADTAIYSAQTVTCESSLFFQDTNSNRLCRRNLLFDYRTPTLQRHRQHWLYHLPKKCQVTFRCPSKDSWTSRTETLSDAGLIFNATKCSITTNNLGTLPEIHGE
jgi:hypothetical protein